MTETLIALLCAHLVADFPLQPGLVIRNKRNPLVLAGHALIVLAVTVLLLGAAPTLLLFILLATHIAMDAVKTWLLPDRLWAFGLDQLVHIAVILGLAIAWPDMVPTGSWSTLPADGYAFYIASPIVVSGIILTVQVGAIVIRLAVRDIDAGVSDAGLPNGGFLIGCLERGLIMILFFIGQPAGVGFLIAAKSILRFGEIQKNERKMSEYIIIGTFMSFSWGLLMSAATWHGASHWLRLSRL